jgi:GNAT superfamily N-acetyltransferase
MIATIYPPILLTARTALSYASLTYPHFRFLFNRFEQFQDSTVAVGYSLFSEPIGLALTQLCPDCQAAHVRSVFVRPAYRGQGIGTALLTRLEQEVAQRTYALLNVEYPADRPETSTWEHILNKAGWQPPRLTSLRCAILGKPLVDELMRAPWMQQTHLPEGFELFLWSDLDADERQQIEAQQFDGQYEHGLEPMIGERPFEPLNSLGLRYHGEVIGWMLTVRTAPGRILYDRLFIAPQFRRRGQAVPLIVSAIQRHYAREGHLPEVGGVWRTQVENLPMVRFIRRRLQPSLSSLVEFNTSYKTLDHASP